MRLAYAAGQRGDLPATRQLPLRPHKEIVARMLTAIALVCPEPGRIEVRDLHLPEPGPGEALVRVAGCGVCHTDISFYTGAVRTRHPLPLVLGHEISGIVVAAAAPFDHLNGQPVVIPAVMPCGSCELCRAGRDTACAKQLMPGNDIEGGFASHILVPARHLVPVGTLPPSLALEELSVVADAVTTPYQALTRAGVAPGDLVVVIGVGGIGTFAVQIAKALGAEVAAIDISDARREAAAQLGARWTFDPAAVDARAIKKQLLSEAGVPTIRWRVMEMSGTARGQELAWTLLPPAGTLGVIGFTMEKPDIRLSNLMALDATAFGSWGCSPALYPAAINLVLKGAVRVRPFVRTYPLLDGAEVLEAAAHHRTDGRRPVLVPPSEI
jgi:6-hydroxycyclohex-1-ene-1-carbonyl-CoA dehydrogenase